MANKKITDATQISTMSGSDKLFVNSGDDLKQITLDQAVAASTPVQQLNSNIEKLDGLSIRRGSFKADLSVGTNNIKIRGSASDKVIEGTLPSSCNAIINTSSIDKNNSFDWGYHFDSMGSALYIYTDIEQQIRFEWIEFL